MDIETQIIAYLQQQKNIVKNDDLAKNFNISRRSVTNYINTINKQNTALISSTNKGYILNYKIDIPQVQDDHIPSNFTERKHYILEKILIANTHPTTYDLADSLCISQTTLMNEISKLRNELLEKNLHIKIKNDRMFIIGEEKDKRKYIMNLLNHELSNSFFSMTSIQKYFNNVKINDIETIVKNTLLDYEYFLDDFSLLNYVMHLAICIETSMTSENPIQTKHINTTRSYTPHIKTIVDRIYEELKKKYKIDFSSEQIHDASVLMSTRIVSKDLNKITFEQIDSFVGEDVKTLLFDIIQSVHDTYGIDLKIDNFMVRFAFHLKNLLLRAENNIALPESNFSSIQNEFPFLYVISAYIASIINKRIDHHLSGSEISCIALHLGVLMEEKKAYYEKLSCVLVLFNYLNITHTIISYLNRFSDKLFVLDIVTSYDKIERIEEVDLVLTTFPPEPTINVPQIQIDIIPSKRNYEDISNMVSELNLNKSRKAALKKVKKFFSPTLFFRDLNFKNQDDCIQFMCKNLIDNGYAGLEFENQIYEHEKVAPSAYKNIAIPHPLSTETNYVEISAIVIYISKKPILWADKEVNMIVMLCLKKEDYPKFKDVFNLITNILTCENSFNKLVEKPDYETFINSLVNS